MRTAYYYARRWSRKGFDTKIHYKDGVIDLSMSHKTKNETEIDLLRETLPNQISIVISTLRSIDQLLDDYETRKVYTSEMISAVRNGIDTLRYLDSQVSK